MKSIKSVFISVAYNKRAEQIGWTLNVYDASGNLVNNYFSETAQTVIDYCVQNFSYSPAYKTGTGGTVSELPPQCFLHVTG